MKNEDLIGFYKKWIDPFFAIMVVAMLVILVGKLVEYNNLQEEISENCGWEEEDTRCFCEKNAVIAAENELGITYGKINLSLDNDNNP